MTTNQENHDLFMLERDSARAEVAALQERIKELELLVRAQP